MRREKSEEKSREYNRRVDERQKKHIYTNISKDRVKQERKNNTQKKIKQICRKYEK